ncbi:uncharacterized protein N7479_009173 [Penicillium vulpinum]|nr:uncharacterized protein N7479_009173 [Penicillium vulpinum]KAJ5950760.1 hypothetical protein N7479_009173 [Penicillium vulpinum]
MFKSMSAARFAPLLRTRVATQTTPSFQAIRCISATAPCNKGPIDLTKETLKKVDRTVADAAVKGINTGEKVTHKVKDVVGSVKEKGGEVKGEAAEYTGKSKGKAAEALGEAKGAVGQAKGKGEELKGEAAGYADKGKIKAEEALNEANEKTKY